MSEYIERNVLLEAVKKMDRLEKETKTPYEYDKQGYLLLINNAPGIEIVRCKECKYWDALKIQNAKASVFALPRERTSADIAPAEALQTVKTFAATGKGKMRSEQKG